MPRIKTDLVEICQACLNGSLDKIELNGSATCLTVTMAAQAIPLLSRSATWLRRRRRRHHIFHAGTAISDQGLVTNGGRCST